jgi:S-adenosylmethionine:tRNA ribosyltransferase-isomerase
LSEVFFDYNLPRSLIAQEPCAERDHSRLLVVRRSQQRIEHHIFAELPELLDPGDLLVLNDTRVLLARLRGRRIQTGGNWEGLFLRADAEGNWELICRARGRLRAGETIVIEPGPLVLILLERTSAGHWIARPSPAGAAEELLALHGTPPLPPYIRKGIAGPTDQDRYQTIYARKAGAVAAPTAGLHFTPQLLGRLESKGIEQSFVTLHIGLGTFRPIQCSDFRKHPMHGEWGELSAATVLAIQRARLHGGKIVAVGTTSVRVLETAGATGEAQPWSGQTDLFIYPPYSFRMVDALITNFHLPRSTLLLLVSAFAGNELVREAYNGAIKSSYRFYSYGDAMLIL